MTSARFSWIEIEIDWDQSAAAGSDSWPDFQTRLDNFSDSRRHLSEMNAGLTRLPVPGRSHDSMGFRMPGKMSRCRGSGLWPGPMCRPSARPLSVWAFSTAFVSLVLTAAPPKRLTCWRPRRFVIAAAPERRPGSLSRLVAVGFTGFYRVFLAVPIALYQVLPALRVALS